MVDYVVNEKVRCLWCKSEEGRRMCRKAWGDRLQAAVTVDV